MAPLYITGRMPDNIDMKPKIFAYSLLFVFAFSVFSVCQAQVIEKVVLCETVKNLEPINPKTSFKKNQKAYCWIRVSEAEVGGQILVEWYYKDALQHTARLDLKYSRMRTYAYKTLHAEGEWRVDIKKQDSTLLQSIKFGVGEVSSDIYEVDTETSTTTTTLTTPLDSSLRSSLGASNNRRRRS